MPAVSTPVLGEPEVLFAVVVATGFVVTALVVVADVPVVVSVVSVVVLVVVVVVPVSSSPSIP